MKSFETGKLTFPFESKLVGGYMWGKKEVARGFDTLTPFLPFKIPHASLVDSRDQNFTIPDAQIKEIIQNSV